MYINLLVRIHLEYAVPVWSPHLAKNVTNLERIQKFGLRMCQRMRDTDYHHL